METLVTEKMNKAQATAEVKRLGYTEHYDTGSCGDRSYGSRLYFKKLDAPVSHGVPTSKHATTSNLGLRYGWVISEFN